MTYMYFINFKSKFSKEEIEDLKYGSTQTMNFGIKNSKLVVFGNNYNDLYQWYVGNFGSDEDLKMEVIEIM